MKIPGGLATTLTVLGLLATSLSSCGPAPKPGLSKDEIIAKAWTAMFGGLKREDLKSLYVESFFHGSALPSRQTVLRPNLFRNDVEGEGVLVFDGKRAAWVMREPDEKGTPRRAELIPAESWRHFEVDIAILLPAFFDHPSEYQGREMVNGIETLKIRVNLPLGSFVTYFLDAGTFLVKKRLVNWNGVEGEDWENIIDAYTHYDGFLFPDGFRYPGRNGLERGTYQNARINVNPAPGAFRIPAEPTG